ncbi:MAG: class I SAM-dependent methyltransferase [Desulfovibrio desulfuricans]|nr:class I SAM-dependent methyltransferase [Desulfovibrio desulfuricans]
METTKEMYADAGEFYDVMSGRLWERRKNFLEALSHVADVEGAVLDIGAGTGHGVVAAAEVLPGVDIFAVEPSPTMRAVLVSRIMQTEGLQRRVTVIPSTFEAAELPERVRAVLFLACIGLMDDAARRAFWARLAAHMSPGGLVLFDVMMIDKPQPVEKIHVAEVAMGQNTYHAWAEGIPVDGLREKWVSTYQIVRNNVVILERHAEYTWQTISLDDVAREAEPYGFVFERQTEDTMIPSGILRKVAM